MPPRWKIILFYVAVLVGLPVAGWSFGNNHFLISAMVGMTSIAAIFFSFSTKRCPSCGGRLLTLSYRVTHCPKCGAAYD